ncbi:hypothetical protein [Paenibacillus agaridevorans]|uniref:hypothetical protein n=1 Tax=Paenibacillus agaridevorans TaxID=171404 RepID=UPI001BE470B3|nr:hypothetical protein [Paenibacillus agaridevorans]
MSRSLYEKWIWIELIGFDNTQNDFAVPAYLERTGFVPLAVSLLLFTPDFVHAHEGMNDETFLPIEVCSYAARPYGKERNRQVWTNYQLRNLIKELQKHGIEVYCSFFDLFRVEQGETPRKSEWCGAHPELYEMNKSGQALTVINPLKRFKDGSYYEDFFVRDLMVVMLDYGFDGYHGADGYTSPRKSLAEADYSDDMVEQFVQYGGLAAQDELTVICDNNPAKMGKRADWIWQHRRLEWIQFHGARWARLWHKIMAAIRQQGKKAYVNTAWTRDPFEALYRYGVDYKQLAATGIDGFIVESVGASLSAGADETEYEPGNEFMSMIMMIKAYVPDTKLICLNAIQDTNEQWDALSHAPTVLERDIYSFSNVYIKGPTGLRRCSDGFMACLGDGINKDGWNWLINRWNLGFHNAAEQLVGASLVWSDQALHESLKHYIVTRDWPAHKFATDWIARGAPVHSVVNVKDLQETTGAIVVTNLHLLPENELNDVLNYRNGSVTMLGWLTESIAQALLAAGVTIEGELNQRFCIIRGGQTDEINYFFMESNGGGANKEVERLKVLDEINDAKSWLDSLYYSPITEQFLQRIVQTLIETAGAPQVIRNEKHIRTVVLQMNSNRWRILIRNLHMNYKSAILDAGRSIDKINILTEFPGIPIATDGSRFRLYVPGRGMVIVELEIQAEEAATLQQ